MKTKKRTIASMMYNWRKKNLLTQMDVAQMFETNQGNISKIENGLRNIPRDKVKWLSAEIGISYKVVSEAWLRMDEEYGAEVL